MQAYLLKRRVHTGGEPPWLPSNECALCSSDHKTFLAVPFIRLFAKTDHLICWY